MKQAASKVEPVLSIFRDHLLYLKHNMNAQAITSIKGEYIKLEHNVEQLIHDMEECIKEANVFINNLQSESKS